jgi:GMP synthase-like glutamine amidotransferase
MGAEVKANPVSEIGWHITRTLSAADSMPWLDGLNRESLLFHWHAETFELPPGGIPILTSRYCKNQGFVYGKTLALQCHIEMTADMVSTWCDLNEGSLKVSDSVQSTKDKQYGLTDKIINLNQVAEILYSAWIKGLE